MEARIDKYKVLAAMVRSFFDAFSSGIIDCQVEDAKEKTKPRTVKKLMLDHYEHIAPVFFDTMFFPLAAMNYSYEDIAALVREAQQRGDDMMALVRTACGDKALYEAMVEEYKRNFSNLLAGHFASNEDHLASYTRRKEDNMQEKNSINEERAIELIVRVVMFAYARGLRQISKDRQQLRQATLFRLMLDAMNVLLLDEAADYKNSEANDLASLFMKVCRTQRNFTVMTDEMDRTYTEIIAEYDKDKSAS